MDTNKKTKAVALLLVFILAAAALAGGIVSNAAAYTTYTYSINGQPLSSPDAYTPEKVITSQTLGLAVGMETPKDLFVDYNNRVYIADPVNNRIIVTDKYMSRVVMTIGAFTNGNGVADSLAAPEGLFVTAPPAEERQYKNGEIFVADTGNRRIVVFDYNGNFLRLFEKPESDIFDSDAYYSPIALAVDNTGRIYVISRTTYEGIIALNADGTFSSIVASQKVTSNLWDAIWSRFQTAAQKAQNKEILSESFNNIAIDESNMIYVTTENVDPAKQQSAISGKSKSGEYAPVKKLNPDGDDIMRRNGFYPPSGEVRVMNALTKTNSGKPTGASQIVDVALGQEGTWSIVDQKRSHIYTYDKNGNLLFIFGDMGSQIGNLKRITALDYQFLDIDPDDPDRKGYAGKLLVLDADMNCITLYKRTEYGNILMTALNHTNNKEYNKAVDDWKDILKRNNNYDAAYVGIGDSLYREGKWKEAMKMYKTAYDTASYSNAFKMNRRDLISKFIIPIIIVVVALIFGIAKFFSFAGKVNAKTALKRGKKNFGEEILYAFHVIFHPFDGFWDLKHEKRGSLRGAIFWLAMVIIAFVYQSFGTGYILSSKNGASVAQSAFTQAIGILVPLLLFVTANWCLTTLFDGEGSYKDVFIATCYAASPLSYLTVLATIISNFVTSSETGFVTLIMGVAWAWFILLLFLGIMTTHDYSIAKNILTSLGSIVGMAIIMFLVILFSGLLMKMTTFVSNIITELSFRF